jgi:hypothetical protein
MSHRNVFGIFKGTYRIQETISSRRKNLNMTSISNPNCGKAMGSTNQLKLGSGVR